MDKLCNDGWKNFLTETYPGSLESPTEMIKMLGSPNLAPDKSIDAKSILHPEDDSSCPQRLVTETLKSCPDGSHMISNNTDTDIPKPCWHFVSEINLMDFEVAANYCQTLGNNGSSQLFNFLDRRDYDILWPILQTGKFYLNIFLRWNHCFLVRRINNVCNSFKK